MTEWVNRLERKLGRFAISHLTLYLVIGQAFVFLYGMLNPAVYYQVAFVPALVRDGEVWRLITFLFDPPGSSWVWIAFVLYFFYFMGTTLESHWGTFRYNLFIFSGWFLTAAVAFIMPMGVVSNAFIGGSVFLAFAYLYPDFVIYIFFIIPVKVRWVAWFMWAVFIYTFVTGEWSTRLSILASSSNFFFFFGKDIVLDLRHGRRRAKAQAQRAKTDAGRDEPRFRCLTCGKDSNQYPQMDFRYCSQCAGEACYCEEHIRNHVHVVSGEAASGKG